MQKESVLIIVGILVASLLLLSFFEYAGIPLGQGTGYQTQQIDREANLKKEITELQEKINKGDNSPETARKLAENQYELLRLAEAKRDAAKAQEATRVHESLWESLRRDLIEGPTGTEPAHIAPQYRSDSPEEDREQRRKDAERNRNR